MAKYELFKGLKKSSLTERELIVFKFFETEALPYYASLAEQIDSNGNKKSLFSFNTSLSKLFGLFTSDKTEKVKPWAKFEQVQRVLSVLNFDCGYTFTTQKDGKDVVCYLACTVDSNKELHITFVDGNHVIIDTEKAKEMNKKAEQKAKEKTDEAKKLADYMKQNNIEKKTVAREQMKKEEAQKYEIEAEAEFCAKAWTKVLELIKIMGEVDLNELQNAIDNRRKALAELAKLA